MADWRKLAIAAFLADGKIDETEVKVLRKELYADGKVRHDEMNFLIELRNLAQKKAKAKKEELLPAFQKFFFKAVEDSVLDNDRISEEETRLLRTALFVDGKVDANELKFLEGLKKKSKDNVHPEFTKFYEEITAKAAKAAKAAAAKK
jgi:uncharacterized membrane protein YebE (DUF533 family)